MPMATIPPACPFYGLTLVLIATSPDTVRQLVSTPSGGNQCGLMTDSFAPCRMEVAGHAPEWRECPRNPELIESILESR
jgi:hypothetical protein